MIGVWKDGTCEECFLIYWEEGNENHFMSGSICARMYVEEKAKNREVKEEEEEGGEEKSVRGGLRI